VKKSVKVRANTPPDSASVPQPKRRSRATTADASSAADTHEIALDHRRSVKGKREVAQIVIRARRAHGDVILSARPGPKTRELLEEARRWFEMQPEQLDLLGRNSGVSADAERFASDFDPTAYRELVGIALAIQFVDHVESPERSGLPAIEGEHFPASATLSRRATSGFVTAADGDRVMTTQGIAYQYLEGGVVAEVELRPEDEDARQQKKAPITYVQAESLKAIARGLDGVDEDVLDVLVANAVTNVPNTKGWYVIDVDAVLEARGRGVRRRKIEGGKTYRAGYSDDHRDEVLGAVRALSQLYIAVGEVRKAGRRRLRSHRPLLIVEEFVRDEARPTRPVVAIAYRFGEGFDGEHMAQVLAPAALLRLNARTEAAEKTLGRYLIQRVDRRGQVVARIADLLSGVGWRIEAGGNRGRIRPRVEMTLQALVEAGVLRRWVYADDSAGGDPRRFADEALPARGWIERWLDFRIVAHVATALEAASLPRLQQ
jgi:hypothetical protein